MSDYKYLLADISLRVVALMVMLIFIDLKVVRLSSNFFLSTCNASEDNVGSCN